MNEILYSIIPLIFCFSIIGLFAIGENIYNSFKNYLNNPIKRILFFIILFLVSIPVGCICFMYAIIFIGSFGLIPTFLYLLYVLIKYVFTGQFDDD